MSTKKYEEYACLQIIYALTTTAIVIVSYCYLFADFNIIVEDIVANWQSKTIMDIQASPYECPDGYDYAYDYIWPGTSKGCWCGNVSISTKSYYEISSDLTQGNCNYNQTIAGCNNVLSTSERSLNTWSSVNGTDTVLCVKRSNETWAQAAPQSGQTCLPNMTKCGQSVNNAFCTYDSQCPINDIQMSDLILPKDSDILSQCNKDNNCVVMAQDSFSAFIIKYQRGDTLDALPTSQIRLNEYSMCFDINQDDYTPGRGSFALLQRSKSDCGQQAAPLWNKSAFHISEARLFDLNGLTGVIKYLNNFGYYSGHHTGADYQYNLFSRSYIPWNPQCRSQMTTLSDKSSELSKLRTIQLIIMILTIIFGLILGIGTPYMISKAYDNSVHEEVKFCQCVDLICKIIQIPLQVFGFVVASHQMTYYRSIVNEGCSSTDILVLFNNIKNDIAITYYGNAACIVCSAIMLFISCCYVYPNHEVYHKKYWGTFYAHSAPDNQAHQDNSLVLDDIESRDTNGKTTPLIPLPSRTEETEISKPLYTPFIAN